MRILIFGILIMLSLFSCMNLGEQPNFELIEVNQQAVDSKIYQDEEIEIILLPQEKWYKIRLNNKSDQQLKIIWNESKFIENSSIGGIVNSDVNLYQELYKIQPSMILADETIVDRIIPVERIYFEEDIAYIADLKIDSLDRQTLELVFQKGDEKLNYVFTFEHRYSSDIYVDGVNKTKFRRSPWYIILALIVTLTVWRNLYGF